MNPQQRRVEMDFEDIGIKLNEDEITSRTDEKGNISVFVTFNGRTVSGSMELFSRAITEHKDAGISIEEAFELYKMY